MHWNNPRTRSSLFGQSEQQDGRNHRNRSIRDRRHRNARCAREWNADPTDKRGNEHRKRDPSTATDALVLRHFIGGSGCKPVHREIHMQHQCSSGESRDSDWHTERHPTNKAHAARAWILLGVPVYPLCRNGVRWAAEYRHHTTDGCTICNGEQKPTAEAAQCRRRWRQRCIPALNS